MAALCQASLKLELFEKQDLFAEVFLLKSIVALSFLAEMDEEEVRVKVGTWFETHAKEVLLKRVVEA